MGSKFKRGDIVIMPGETILEGDTMSVGIVIEPEFNESSNRVLLRWLDSDQDDHEPADWLQVVGHINQWQRAIAEVHIGSDL